MKIQDIKTSLGIGTIVNENDCMFLESTKEWYDKIKYNENLLLYFNSLQGGNYKKAMNHKYVYSFFSRGNEMVFYALYEVLGKTTVKEAIKNKIFPPDMLDMYIKNIHKVNIDSEDPFFLIKQIETPGRLEKRLVTKNVKGQATIIGFPKFSQYEVLAIERTKLATEFSSYSEVCLKYDELRTVIGDDIWQDKLSRFGGVYLIHDNNTGKNYVGSAYNENGGFLGRWKNYANNPTGGNNEEGNKMLVELLNKNMHGNNTKLNGDEYARKFFIYSILEVLPLGNTKQILDAEKRWKKHLGTRDRAHGLNAN